MASVAETTHLGPLASAFRAQARRRVAERVPLGLAILLVGAFTGAALEWFYFPERRLTLVATDALFLGVAVLLHLVIRRRVDLAIVIAVLGVNAIGIGSNLYHWTSGASAERSLLIVTALCSVVAIILPWGWRSQALACLGPVSTYILTLFVSGTVLGLSGGLVAGGPLTPLLAYPLLALRLSVLLAQLTHPH